MRCVSSLYNGEISDMILDANQCGNGFLTAGQLRHLDRNIHLFYNYRNELFSGTELSYVNSKYFPAFFGSLFPAGFGSQKPAFHTRFLFPGIAPRVFFYVTEMEVLHLPSQNFRQSSIQAHLILYHTVAFFPTTLVALPLTSLQTTPTVQPQIALR